MNIRRFGVAVVLCAVAGLAGSPVAAQVTPRRAQQIRKVAKELKPSATPKKARVVLIWNTPPHLMQKDPHKGYCIPFGEEALKAIGEETGAYQAGGERRSGRVRAREPEAVRRDRAQ